MSLAPFSSWPHFWSAGQACAPATAPSAESPAVQDSRYGPAQQPIACIHLELPSMHGTAIPAKIKQLLSPQAPSVPAGRQPLSGHREETMGHLRLQASSPCTPVMVMPPQLIKGRKQRITVLGRLSGADHGGLSAFSRYRACGEVQAQSEIAREQIADAYTCAQSNCVQEHTSASF